VLLLSVKVVVVVVVVDVLLQTDPTLPVLQALEKCMKEKDNAWFDKFLLSGGAQALFDVIALKVCLKLIVVNVFVLIIF
jgi:hypothetical protein